MHIWHSQRAVLLLLQHHSPEWKTAHVTAQASYMTLEELHHFSLSSGHEEHNSFDQREDNIRATEM